MLQGSKWETTAQINRKQGNALPIRTLYNRHFGQTGILVASGQSLDKCLRKLKFVSSPILAVNRAYPALEIMGIEPTYVFNVDALSKPIDNKKEVPLICARKSSPEFRDKWNGQIFEFDDIVGNDPWSVQYRKDNPNLDYLPGGGNVSTLMLNIALSVLGMKRIVFVGHDFWTPYNDEYDFQNESYRQFLQWTVQLIGLALQSGVEFVVEDVDLWMRNCPPELRWIIHHTRPMKLEDSIACFRL